jgi:SAM-dependent methyltransferase
MKLDGVRGLCQASLLRALDPKGGKMFRRFIFSHFRKPRGIVGSIVGRWMAKGNLVEAEWTLDLIRIHPDDHILEIGFGPGVAVQLASRFIVNGLVSGIDISDAMLRAARRRNQKAIEAGRVDLKLGNASSLPYPDATFHKAYVIHGLYFWSDPVACLRELHRVLRPEGLVAITILPREKWEEGSIPPRDIFTLYSSQEVQELLTQVGFVQTRIEVCPRPDEFPGECVLGAK